MFNAHTCHNRNCCEARFVRAISLNLMRHRAAKHVAATLQFLTLGATDQACFIFLVYRNNCEIRHPHGGHPTATRSPFYGGPFARKIPEAAIVGATALRYVSQIDRRERKKGRRNVGPSLWNYVTVN